MDGGPFRTFSTLKRENDTEWHDWGTVPQLLVPGAKGAHDELPNKIIYKKQHSVIHHTCILCGKLNIDKVGIYVTQIKPPQHACSQFESVSGTCIWSILLCDTCPLKRAAELPSDLKGGDACGCPFVIV